MAARRGTVAGVVAVLGVLAVVATRQGWLSAEAASVLVAAATLLVAVLAQQTAVEAHDTAVTVARIERDRRHAEMTPQVSVAIRHPNPSVFAPVLSIELEGPAWLPQVDEVVVRVRDDTAERGASTYGGVSTADYIWGPLRFDANDELPEPGRDSQPFTLVMGTPKPLRMCETAVPPWQSTQAWRDLYRGSPVRLWIECRHDGHTWFLHRAVPVTYAQPSP